MDLLLKPEDPVYGGYVICRDEGIVFVRGAVPGEVVRVSVLEKKKDYRVASVQDVIEPSPYRVSPPCEYFGSCGGCQLQFISYDKQVSMKNDILADCLKRIGKLELSLSEPLASPKEFSYRLRGQFKVSRDGSFGFYREGTRDVVDIKECLLMDERINSLIKRVRTAVSSSRIKEVHITTGDLSTALIKGIGFDEAVADEFVSLGFEGVAFEDGSCRGEGFVKLENNGLTYCVSPWSFLQSNWEMNLMISGLIRSELSGLQDASVLDLYAGGGNFSMPLHETASGVLAVEENPHSVKDGQRNLSLNKIKNFKFQNAKAEKSRLKDNYDIVLLNPPRPGLTPAVADMVIELKPRRVVYVSCNPSTLARDLRKFSDKYTIDSVRLADSFPNTYHIESVAFLSLKGLAAEDASEKKASEDG